MGTPEKCENVERRSDAGVGKGLLQSPTVLLFLFHSLSIVASVRTIVVLGDGRINSSCETDDEHGNTGDD